MKVYEMQPVILIWRMAGSVIFFVAFALGNKYTVVWDRLEESWTVTKNDVYLTNVSSPAKGKAYAERDAATLETGNRA